jgi:hypothetical protein
MAELRCPMCGKPNPSDLEVCQYCGARLVPLVSETPPQEQTSTPPEEPASEESPIHPQEGASDWLSDLRQEGEEEVLSGEYQSSGEEETPDWLNGLRPEAEDVPEDEWEAEGESDLEAGDSDWLQRIHPEEEGPVWQDAEEEKEEQGAEEEGLPADFGAEETFSEFEKELDWLGASEQETGSESEPEELPDWLQQAAPFEEEPEPESAAEGELPDWLAELSEEPSSGSESPTEWQIETTPDEEGPAPEPTAAQEELPDWFAESSEEPSLESELAPDWLAEAVPGEEERAPEPTGTPEELSEWISELSEEPSPETETPPDWLAEAGQAQGEPSAEPTEAAEVQAVPEWLASEESEPLKHLAEDLEEGEPQAAEAALPESMEEDLSGILSEELSADWLSPEQAEEDQGEAEEAEPALVQAEIPSWLEALRPIEDAAPSIPIEEEDEARVESAGPLAGLSGVLSAEPGVAKVQKPPTYSIKLQVSESQRARVDVLRNMVAEEGKAQPIARPAVISSQHILRWVIALVLILAVLWPVITGSQQAPLPTFSPGTAAVNQVINQLPGQARVLISFDYEPALSGEMDAAASAVVDHLMLRGAYLTLVSTSPSGPIVAARFLAVTQSDHNYVANEQYVNLGYIPGGAAGLLGFAESPQRILPFSLDGGRAAWGGQGRQALPPLQGIENLSDFSLIMVITASPTVARTWVEQVQPFLAGGAFPTPLVMILSAQAGPLVQPYYQANPRQIQGLVTGLRDGAAYANLTGRSGLPRKYWDAFSVGLVLAGVLITIGGMASIALLMLSRYRKSEG